MSSIPTQILLLLVLLILNGAFVLAEIAVISSRKARLQQQANEGNKRAGAALALAKNPNDFLSAVQIGITLINILHGRGQRMALSPTPWLGRSGIGRLTSPYADPLATGHRGDSDHAPDAAGGRTHSKASRACMDPSERPPSLPGRWPYSRRYLARWSGSWDDVTDLTLTLFGRQTQHGALHYRRGDPVC